MTEHRDLELSKLMHLLEAGTSAPLAVKEAARQLQEAGFTELEFEHTWGLEHGGKYFLRHHDTTLLAFTVGEQLQYRDGFRIAAAHTDYPCFRIKPNPGIEASGYRELNLEVYGGPILNTWLDRPLGISGRVAAASDEIMHPRMYYVNSKRPLAVIPNLAVHLNREVNQGQELNRQTDLLPLIGTLKGELEQNGDFLNYLAEKLEIDRTEILDYELWLTCLQQPQLVGVTEDFLVSPRLDNLTSVQALLSGIIGGTRKEGVQMIALFDHEEVGSKSKQGASSLLLLHVMEKICGCFGWASTQQKEAIYGSMLLSADVAHGMHPNYVSKMDLTSQPLLNGGVCIKEACSQSYATDCRAVAIIEQICRAGEIPYQKYVNRSDVRGGRTLSSLVSGIIPIPAVDVGVPILAMHSAVETMGAQDQKSLTDLVTSFFSV